MDEEADTDYNPQETLKNKKAQLRLYKEELEAAMQQIDAKVTPLFSNHSLFRPWENMPTFNMSKNLSRKRGT
jgi:hypothetical protein